MWVDPDPQLANQSGLMPSLVCLQEDDSPQIRGVQEIFVVSGHKPAEVIVSCQEVAISLCEHLLIYISVP